MFSIPALWSVAERENSWYNNNIKQKIFPMKSEKVLIIADGAAFGPQMNDIYAYDPDTEEEAGQCVDEVIQIAEESGAEIQFY